MAPPHSAGGTGEVEGLATVLDTGLFGQTSQERFDALRRFLGDPASGDTVDVQGLESIGQDLHDNKLNLKDALGAYRDKSDSRRWPVVVIRPNGDHERVEDRILTLGFEILPNLASAYRRVGLIPMRVPPEFPFLEALSRRPDISRIERSWLSTTVPLSHEADTQHALAYPDELINADGFDKALYTKRDPVRVGLLDSGIDARHPILQGRMMDQRAFLRDLERVGDRFGHGTAVAGTIAKMCPSATFYSAKVLGEDGRGHLDDAIRGIGWLRRQKPDVVVCSLNIALQTKGRAVLSALLADMARLGILVIIPTRNPEGDLGCPSDAEGIVSVAMANANRGQRATLRARGSSLRVPRSIQANRERFPMLQPTGWTSFDSPSVAAGVTAGTACMLIRVARLFRHTPSGADLTAALLSGCAPDGPRVLDPHKAVSTYHKLLQDRARGNHEPPTTRIDAESHAAADLRSPPKRTPTNKNLTAKRQPPKRTPTPTGNQPHPATERGMALDDLRAAAAARKHTPLPEEAPTAINVPSMEDVEPATAINVPAIEEEPPTMAFSEEPSTLAMPEVKPGQDLWDDANIEDEGDPTVGNFEAGWLSPNKKK